MAMIKRTSVSLPDDLTNELAAQAELEYTSVPKIIRKIWQFYKDNNGPR